MTERLVELLPGYEWLFYLRKVIETERFIVVGDPFIPRQRVTPASVEVEEASPPEHNVVVHCHPFGLEDFSSIDEEYINANNEISILYVPSKGFVKAIAKRRVPCGEWLWVPVRLLGIAVLGDVDKASEEVERLVSEALEEKIVEQSHQLLPC